MTGLFLAPDIEQMVSSFLRDQPEATDILGDRIYTEIPQSPTWPLARITLIDGAPTDRIGWLNSPLLQIEVWGGPKATAYTACATLTALMRRMRGTHDLGVVTETEVVSSPTWRPDDTFKPAKPRYIAQVRLWVHP